jgi:Fe-S cluster assembly scaffold protein SufB
MDYNSFISEASSIYAESKEEKSEIYKRYYINMEKSAADALSAAERGPDNAALTKTAEQVGSELSKIDAFVFDSELVKNGSPILKSVDLEKVRSEFFSERIYKSEDDKYAALVNWKAKKAIVIDVPAGEKRDLSIVMMNASAFVPLQIIINIAEDSTLNLSEFYLSADNNLNSLVAPLHEVRAGKGSKAEINVIHNENSTTDVLHLCKAEVGESGRLKINVVYNGGRFTRSRSNIRTCGKAATGEINESMMSVGGQRFDLYTYVANDAPKSICHSETKVILADNSSGYVKGFAKILQGASGSRSYVEEKGLILDKGAHVDLIPDMSIDQNDVKATHSGASAPLDQNALFYLMSRGADVTNARRLIINGFLSSLLSKIENFGAKRTAFALLHDKVTEKRFGHIPKVDMVDMWIPETAAEHSIFGGHYKYRE